MSTNNRRNVRKVRKARVVPQTQFDRQLIRIEQLVQEFHDLIKQQREPSEFDDATYAKLCAIRLQHLPEAVQSLLWAMKKSQMRAFPLEANGP